ncbi:hypothetical protein [Flagellimonas marina]|uniref:DNA polymerase beta thumb domain-containing protein n=1 Tax=Flagellimonas marina TaxID=1775168 RepID=A0ABV8PG87_9FLAO
MKLETALIIAQQVKAKLAPHCERIEIAGSIRRKRPEVKDIEIVAIPKPYDTGLFENGVASVVNKWVKVKGELPCKYTQRLLPDGIKLDLFFATKENWGLIFAIRTGSADFSHKVLATGWTKRGYSSKDGMLRQNFKTYPMREEKDVFNLIGLPYVSPEKREI